jgi:hypothetical protein
VSGAALQRFIRDTLGCGCPDSVLEAIAPVQDLDELGGLPVRLVLDVDGRLLVAVVPAAAADARGLQDALGEGRELRDARGMNRFRLVLEGEVAPALMEALRMPDERVHVHVVAAEEVPATDGGASTGPRNGAADRS